MSILTLYEQIRQRFIYGYKRDSSHYIAHLRSIGMSVGDRVTIPVPASNCIDETRPWLIRIGNDVQIARGVTILTHGYDWSVLKGVFGDVLGSSGSVSIGNNVFIGMNSTILKGVHIGNNVIIGAGSIVTKNIPDNMVAVGNPCKVIMTIEEYYEKRKGAQLGEATELVRLYRERYGKEPDDKVLHEFFWLFSDADSELTEKWKSMMKLVGNEEFSYEQLAQNKKQFKDMKAFLISAMQENV